jgi:2-succinyl-5-enolpyruvyl-6-hydroxy-3-cyclohexene-1-carboxylate synthase
MIDFRNTNTIWASILVETLYKLGLKTAILCPGSRSTPLNIAFATHPHIETIPVLDERSASFFALGIAKKSGIPVALVCTSGTAGANFYPAIIEAKYSHVSLLILTADRPPELRDCHGGQTIDQLKLYGNYPNWQGELALPSLDLNLLKYLRQTIIFALEKTLFPIRGVVHLNCPFRKPLEPIEEENSNLISLQKFFNNRDFFVNISPFSTTKNTLVNNINNTLIQEWKNCEQGLIIAGVDQSYQPWEYCHSIASLSQYLGWPVLGEGLSPIRNYAGLNPYLITNYDVILRQDKYAHKLAPKKVIQIGELPTSVILREYLKKVNPQRLIFDPTGENIDPLHGQTTHLRIAIEEFVNVSTDIKQGIIKSELSSYLKQWHYLDQKTQQKIDQTMNNMTELFEGKTSWLLSQTLPSATPIFIANSMSVRNVEYFWTAKNTGILPFFNRGVNGIDGTLSTALGIAHNSQSVLLTGDLAFLHDLNGLLIKDKFKGHLTIILINNEGGGIFENLPIAQFEETFEEYFATPQNINFEILCQTYQIEYYLISNWQDLKTKLNPLPENGIRLLEIKTNRKKDAQWLRFNLKKMAYFEKS